MGFNIGIDIQSTRGKASGLGVYTRNFIEALKRERPEDMKITFYSRPDDTDLNTWQRCFWENLELPKLARKDNVDVLHVPAFSPPLSRGFRLVVTVHDIIGKLFPNQLGLPSALYWGKWLPFSIKRADLIIADTEYTKKDLMTHLGVPSEKIHVIYASGHEGFSSELLPDEKARVKQAYGIREEYFLFVGTLEPRKNLSRVLEAFAAYRAGRNGHGAQQLVVVGSKDFAHGQYYKKLLREARLREGDVIFTGYVSHADLNALYTASNLLVFPSLYEGFGIPVLEAMASGTPVLTARATSIPEVAGDAAYYVDPYRVEEIVRGMIDLSENAGLRNSLIKKGLQQKNRFSWDRTARETLEVYRRVVANGS
ncbi:MAG: glycosyltransferase family 1 protein [Candidatus Omnitrophota bacterium]|nr:glycosyltransferase family 1 protein [Candidatus Omnitrophota bacterium]